MKCYKCGKTMYVGTINTYAVNIIGGFICDCRAGLIPVILKDRDRTKDEYEFKS